MKQKSLFNLLLMLTIQVALSQKFELSPLVDATTSVKDGLLEAGTEFKFTEQKKIVIENVENTIDGNIFTIKTTMRLPLTDKTENVLQVDRFTSTWKFVTALQYTIDNTSSFGSVSRHSFSGQGEFGSNEFKYYPTAVKTNEVKTNENSYSFEVKYVGFFSSGSAGSKQWSPQFRVRYSYDWEKADAVGVVHPPNENGVTTTTDMVIEAPSAKALLSPAFSLQYYPGTKNFSYSPTVYYDFTGKANDNSPFDNLSRLRIESWIFYYPSIANSPNVKIGISPFLSIRTMGTDSFNKYEFGGSITIKIGTSFLQFL